MSLVYTVTGEVMIKSPEGTVKIDVSSSGVVHVHAVDGDDEPIQADRWRWFLNMIKAAREAIKTGKAPTGFQVGGTEPTTNKAWYLKMFESGYGAVWRGRSESRFVQPVTGPTKLRNGLVFHPG